MFGNMGLHVIKNPAGTYSYVGTIPASLVKWVEPTRYDIMAGRVQKNSEGKLLAWKGRVFDTRENAVQFAESRGHSVQENRQ